MSEVHAKKELEGERELRSQPVPRYSMSALLLILPSFLPSFLQLIGLSLVFLRSRKEQREEEEEWE